MKNTVENTHFSFGIPTKVYFGEDSLKANAEVLRGIGKRAFIVCGKNSARACGALEDVLEVLDSLEIEHNVYEGITNNPNVVECKEVGKIAREYGADFVIGIGGGSPLDAAKAVAVFAKNDIHEMQLFNYDYENGVLPIIALPTTFGTGSEITQYSIMTVDELKTKKSFGCDLTYPRISFVDPKYSFGLNPQITRNTALDAFTHCFESLFSLNASPITDAWNLYALNIFGSCFDDLMNDKHEAIRERLALVSLFGGASISQTGTTLMHAMGYPLTYFYGLAHGAANATVLPVYLDIMKTHRFNKLKPALEAMNLTYDELLTRVSFKYRLNNKLSDEEIDLFAKQTTLQGSAKNSGVPCSEKDFVAYFKALC